MITSQLRRLVYSLVPILKEEKMKKRSILAVVLIVALASGLMAAGCAKPAPAPAPAPAPVPTGEITVPPGETYEWQLFSLVPLSMMIHYQHQ